MEKIVNANNNIMKDKKIITLTFEYLFFRITNYKVPENILLAFLQNGFNHKTIF